MRPSTGKILRAAFAIAFLSVFVSALPVFAGVTVSSPSNGATVSTSTSVHVVASATSSYPITSMRIYLDSTSMYTVNAAKLDTYVSASAGTHSLTVQAWDSTGAVYKTPLTIYVSAATTSSATTSSATTTSTSTSANDRFVCTNGSDSNSGLSGHPWKTMAHANSVAQPGYVIHFCPGTYYLYPSVSLTKSGTSSAPITYVSDSKWGAKIISSGSSAGGIDWNTAVSVSGSYIIVKDFEITSVNSRTLYGGIGMGGSYQSAVGNYIHDIPAPGPVGAGGCGICVSNWKATGNQVVGNKIVNVGFANGSWRTHGIYFQNHNGYVANNIVNRSSGWGIKLGHSFGNNQVVNNTVVGNYYGGIDLDCGLSDNGGVKCDYVWVANNIVYANGYTPPWGQAAGGNGIEEYDSASEEGSHFYYDNNLVYGNKPGNWKLMVHGGSGTNTVTAAPSFVNWQLNGTGDYHLSGGVAVNKGTSSYGVNPPTFDFSLVTRPINGAWDLGAYESKY